MQGAGDLCFAGVYTVAFNFTPSRMGILTAHWKLTAATSGPDGAGSATDTNDHTVAHRHRSKLRVFMPQHSARGPSSTAREQFSIWVAMNCGAQREQSGREVSWGEEQVAAGRPFLHSPDKPRYRA
jgi:hypothetical protein